MDTAIPIRLSLLRSFFPDSIEDTSQAVVHLGVRIDSEYLDDCYVVRQGLFLRIELPIDLVAPCWDTDAF